MKTEMTLDTSGRFVVTKKIREAAGLTLREKVDVHVSPGRILIEVKHNPKGKLIKRGKLKVWTGSVPGTSLETAVEQSRHYTR